MTAEHKKKTVLAVPSEERFCALYVFLGGACQLTYSIYFDQKKSCATSLKLPVFMPPIDIWYPNAASQSPAISPAKLGSNRQICIPKNELWMRLSSAVYKQLEIGKVLLVLAALTAMLTKHHALKRVITKL